MALNIKNPICLVGSKVKKVVVDNVNMTIDIYTKEVPSEEQYFYITAGPNTYTFEYNENYNHWYNYDNAYDINGTVKIGAPNVQPNVQKVYIYGIGTHYIEPTVYANEKPILGKNYSTVSGGSN